MDCGEIVALLDLVKKYEFTQQPVGVCSLVLIPRTFSTSRVYLIVSVVLLYLGYLCLQFWLLFVLLGVHATSSHSQLMMLCQ